MNAFLEIFRSRNAIRNKHLNNINDNRHRQGIRTGQQKPELLLNSFSGIHQSDCTHNTLFMGETKINSS